MKPNRSGTLDTLRGLTLLSMMAYHGCWDLVYLRGPQKSTYFCKKDKKVSDTGREGGGEDRVSR